MPPLVVAAIVGGIVAALAWLAGAGPIAAAVVFLGVMAFAWVQARAGAVLDGPSSKAPPVVVRNGSIDVGEELLDLLSSTRVRATRVLEDSGRLEPFVMFEDAQGQIRAVRVPADDPEAILARAREAARSIDASAPRVVLAVEDRVSLDGRVRRVVRYEAAERRFGDRTLVFVQPIRARRLILPATTTGRPMYVGDGEHTLRFSRT